MQEVIGSTPIFFTVVIGYSLIVKGGLAQLARAPALQAGGQRFESVILHFGQWIAYYGMFCSFLSTVL